MGSITRKIVNRKMAGNLQRRKFTGRFDLRICPDLHERIAALADASGKRINSWMLEALDQEARQQSD
jgi:predicted HicB family RNase H-like nuclease